MQRELEQIKIDNKMKETMEWEMQKQKEEYQRKVEEEEDKGW